MESADRGRRFQGRDPDRVTQDREIRFNDSPEYAEQRQKWNQINAVTQPDPDISGYLQKIKGADGDFSELEDLFDRQLWRSGIREKRPITSLLLVQLTPELWQEHERGSNSYMSHHVVGSVVTVNDAFLRKEYPSEALLRVGTLHDFVHEVGHFVSENAMYESDVNPNDRFIVAGLKQFEIEEKERVFSVSSIFEIVDEAVNDDLAEEVAREFALSTGYATGAELDAYYKDRLASGHRYGLYRSILDGLVTKVANDLGIGETQVRMSLRQGALEGINLMMSESDEPLLDQVMPPGFTSDLAGLRPTLTSMNEFVQKYGLGSFVEIMEKRMREHERNK